MKKLNKISIYLELFDLYKKMLTEYQREVFELYYFYDYTLQEIADSKKISKNAVHDNLKKTEKSLLIMEEKIGFFKFKKQVNKKV